MLSSSLLTTPMFIIIISGSDEISYRYRNFQGNTNNIFNNLLLSVVAVKHVRVNVETCTFQASRFLKPKDFAPGLLFIYRLHTQLCPKRSPMKDEILYENSPSTGLGWGGRSLPRF